MELTHVVDDKVVALFERTGPVIFPAVSQVDAYWEALRAGRPMPDRSEIDPRGLEAALEFAFILEHIAPGVGRIRISGMHLNDLLGMEVRGMPLTAFFTPDARDRLSRTLEQVITIPQVAELTLTGGRSIGRPELSARLYLAPLSTRDAGAPRVLGCLQSRGAIGRPPRRFAIDEVHLRRIVDAAGAMPEATPDHAAHGRMPAASQFSEPAAAYSHRRQATAARPLRGRPNLRLVKSDD